MWKLRTLGVTVLPGYCSVELCRLFDISSRDRLILRIFESAPLVRQLGSRTPTTPSFCSIGEPILQVLRDDFRQKRRDGIPNLVVLAQADLVQAVLAF